MSKEKRLEFHKILKEATGLSTVYFQPPSNLVMKYPCIVYGLNKYKDDNANNELYKHKTAYEVTYIDRNPETDIQDKLNAIPYSTLKYRFVVENLYHYVFEIYF